MQVGERYWALSGKRVVEVEVNHAYASSPGVAQAFRVAELAKHWSKRRYLIIREGGVWKTQEDAVLGARKHLHAVTLNRQKALEKAQLSLQKAQAAYWDFEKHYDLTPAEP